MQNIVSVYFFFFFLGRGSVIFVRSWQSSVAPKRSRTLILSLLEYDLPFS